MGRPSPLSRPKWHQEPRLPLSGVLSRPALALSNRRAGWGQQDACGVLRGYLRPSHRTHTHTRSPGPACLLVAGLARGEARP